MIAAPRLLAFALALVAGVAATTARAQVCGDGILDAGAGEACDDGSANGAFLSCCTAACALRTAGEACRAGGGACDPAETCDGIAPSCPADVTVPDGDGDGACDVIDVCPTTPDPDQADDDGDALGNACDPCTSVAPIAIAKAVLKITKLATGPGDDRLKLKASVSGVPELPGLDLVTEGLRFLLTDALGTPIIDARLPGGQYSSSVRAGWKGSGSGWSYANGGAVLPLIQGLTKVSVKGRPTRPGQYSITVVGKNGSYAVAPGTLPLLATIVLDPPVATTGQCVEIGFTAPPGCIASPSGTIACK